MGRLFDLFRHSPFEPLREHMDKVMACVNLVRPLFDAVRDGRYDEMERLTRSIFKTEHEADLIKDEIRQTIPKTFYLPVYRGDLLGYLKLQDDMADTSEDVAYLLTIKRIALPPAIREQTTDYTSTVMRVVELTQALTLAFQKTVERGLQPAMVEQVLADVRGVELAEWESDRTQYKLSRALFALEGEVSPLDIMLWFKVFGELAKLANTAESIADRIRRMITSR